MSATRSVLLVRTDGSVHQREIAPGPDAICTEISASLFQHLPLPWAWEFVILADEEGALLDTPQVNRLATEIAAAAGYDCPIYGDVLLIGAQPDSDRYSSLGPTALAKLDALGIAA